MNEQKFSVAWKDPSIDRNEIEEMLSSWRGSKKNISETLEKVIHRQSQESETKTAVSSIRKRPLE